MSNNFSDQVVLTQLEESAVLISDKSSAGDAGRAG